MRQAVRRIRKLPVNWSTVAPTACAIHCAATPFLVAVAPAFVRETTVEWSLLGVTLLIAIVVLRNGHRAHGSHLPLAVTAAGVGLWVASLLGAFQPVPEDVSTPIAALAAASGFLWNARLHHPGDGEGCT